MKKIDTEAVSGFLWLIGSLTVLFILSRVFNPNGIPDEAPEPGIGFIPEVIILLIILAVIFIAAYGLRDALIKTKDYFKLPVTDKLEKLFIGLFILFNPLWAILGFMNCVVINDNCGVYSTLTPHVIYLAMFLFVMASYYLVLKIKRKSNA